MAIKLGQGADPALVKAATTAGLASAPQDYSKTFRSAADSYQKSMMASADMWEDIGQAVMYVAGEVKKKIDGPPKSQDLEDQMARPEAEGIKKTIQEARDAIARTYGFKDQRKTIPDPTGKIDERKHVGEEEGKIQGSQDPTERIPGVEYDESGKYTITTPKENPDYGKPLQIDNPDYGKRMWPGSKEAKDERRKWNKVRNDLNAQLQHLGGNADATVKMHADGMVDQQATGLYGMEINNALIASSTGKTTGFGNSLVIDKNKDGDLIYTMHHDPSKIDPDLDQGKIVANLPFSPISPAEGIQQKAGPVIGSDGKPLTFTANEIKELNVLKDPKLMPNIKKDQNAIGRLGYNSKTGLDNYTKNQIKEIVDKYSGNRAAWYAPNYTSDTGGSFHERATNPSGLSAGIFNTLGEVLPKDVKTGQLKQEGILSGIKDVDGVPGITLGDFQNADNMKALQLAMFNPGDGNYDKAVTSAVCDEDRKKGLEDWHEHNRKLNPANRREIGGKGGFTPIKGTGSVDVQGKSGDGKGYIPKSAINYIGQNATSRNPIDMGAKGMFNWDKGRETYTMGDGIIKNKDTLFATIFGNDFNPTSIMPLYSSIPDWDGSAYMEKEKSEKGKTDLPIVKKKGKNWMKQIGEWAKGDR